MRISFAVCFIIFLAASCGKDKFSDKPMLKLKSVSSDYIPKGGAVQIRFEYTDAQGDIGGMPLHVQKLSSSFPCADNSKDPTFIDSANYLIPADLPPSSNQKGEIVITWEYFQLQPIPCSSLDTLEEATFKFWLKDKAGNISDTITVPPITIEK